MFCQLTQISAGVYGLPVTGTFTRDRTIPVSEQIGIDAQGQPIRENKMRQLSVMSEAQRQSAGFATYAEDGVETLIYTHGAPTDVLSAAGVRRTYPSKTYRPAADLRKDKLAALAARRWAIASGGTLVNGVKFKTDDASYNELDTCIRQIERGQLTPPVRFTSGTSGNFLADQATLQGLLNAMTAHRQAARAAEYAHAVVLAGMTDPAAVAAYDVTLDAAGAPWPANPQP